MSYLELLSLRSMMAWGHRVKLYHYRPITNAPDWLELADANEIRPYSEEQLKAYDKSMTVISNLFRYTLQAKTDEIWCDCDVFFLRPLPDQDYIFTLDKRMSVAGIIKHVNIYNPSLLRLPKGSPIANDMVELFESETPFLPEDSPFYFDGIKSTVEDLQAQGGNGNVHVADLIWGTTGPRTLSHFVYEHDLQKYAWPRKMHQPIVDSQIAFLARPRATAQLNLPLNSQSIHYYGSVLRRRLIGADVFKNNEPLPGSFLAERMKDLEIDPKEAPLVTAFSRLDQIQARQQQLSEAANDAT